MKNLSKKELIDYLGQMIGVHEDNMQYRLESFNVARSHKELGTLTEKLAEEGTMLEGYSSLKRAMEKEGSAISILEQFEVQLTKELLRNLDAPRSNTMVDQAIFYGPVRRAKSEFLRDVIPQLKQATAKEE